MKSRLNLIAIVATLFASGIAIAHHSPDHSSDSIVLLAPPEGLGYLWWVLGPFLLLVCIGVVRAVRRYRGRE